MTSHHKSDSSLFAVSFVAITLLLSGCSSKQLTEDGVEVVEVVEVDPYEGFNRTMFSLNDGVDKYFADPVSDAYTWVTPQFVQTGVTNFFDNLKGINVVLNDLMQGKGKQGAEDTGRFLVNSTVGLLGLFDVATEIGLEQHNEDFAQTLAVWGVSQGPYLVLPLLGPSTTRGIPGGIFDAAANPATYVGVPIQVVQMLNARANADSEINFVEEAALDRYVFTRESFLQYRDNLINDGKIDDSDALFDFEEEDDDFGDEELTKEVLDKKAEVSDDGIAVVNENKEIIDNEKDAAVQVEPVADSSDASLGSTE